MNAWLYALGATPRRTREAFCDPIRRLHILVKVLRLTVDAAAVVVVLPYQPWLAAPAAVALDYGLFEYAIEPWSKVRVRAGKASLQGNYWETGPQDGERYIYD